MFAHAARSYTETSQTFVQLHAESLAPGETVYLTYSPKPPEWMNGAALCDLGGRIARFEMQGVKREALPAWIKPGARDRAVARFLKDHGVTTLLSEFGPFSNKLVAGALAADVRAFVHFHGWDASRVLRKPRVVQAYQKMFSQIAGVFTPSQFIANNLIDIGCQPEMIQVCPCGVDAAAFPPTKSEPGRMLFVGRFVEKKAPGDAVQAFSKIAKKHPQARFDMVGDGPLLRACEDKAKELGVQDRITFHGRLSHTKTKALMQKAAIYVQPSVTAQSGDVEGLPVAILEAMCSGHCVLATRHSGIPEAVIDGASGFLVDEGDVAGLAANMDHVLSNPSEQTRVGAAARARVLNGFTNAHSTATLRRTMGLEGRV